MEITLKSPIFSTQKCTITLEPNINVIIANDIDISNAVLHEIFDLKKRTMVHIIRHGTLFSDKLSHPNWVSAYNKLEKLEIRQEVLEEIEYTDGCIKDYSTGNERIPLAIYALLSEHYKYVLVEEPEYRLNPISTIKIARIFMDLAIKYDKILVMSTTSPLVLNELNNFDREKSNIITLHQNIRNLYFVSDPIKVPKETKITMGEAWVNGYLGTTPDIDGFDFKHFIR